MFDSPANFIGGKRVVPNGTAQVQVINPATEQPVFSFAAAGPAEIAAAVAAAETGMIAWRAKSGWERSAVLRRISQLMKERIDEIARLMTLEIGKPLAESKAEITNAYEHFDWCADEARRLYDYRVSGRTGTDYYEIRHEPIGIVLALTAWNFPVSLPARKLAMALAAGCAVILRPASEAPAAAAAMVQCCHEAGLPDGALNMLIGPPDTIVGPLMAEPRVRKVSFTGSTRVGQLLIQQSAETVKKLTLELGGHAPFLVLEDADVALAAKSAIAAKFRNAGQVCTCPSRFYVHESVAGDFIDRLVAGASSLKVGDGLDPATQMGPVANLRQRDRVERLVADAIGKGAKLAAGGKRPSHANAGYFYEPTVLVDVPDDAAVMHEEPFGPVAAIVRVKDTDEAVARANQLEYALSSFLFSQSARRIADVSDRIEAGLVGINNVVVAMPEAAFGGNKASGFGREGGHEGVAEYLTTKMKHHVLN